MTGGSLSAGFNENVGDTGNGSFTQSGGTNSCSFFYVGANAGSSGTYSLSGSGPLSSSFEWVGNSGTGAFTQTGGNNSPSFLTIANNAGSSGAYSLAQAASCPPGFKP